MSSAISGSLNLSRAQSQIPIDETGAASNIQNFSTYDAVELIGYVFVDGSSADYRASVKLSIVKNGAGSYEVAASDIAGDDYSGSPIVSFSMSGSLLQATLDSALVAAESPSESYIRYALSAPAVGGQDNISIDASKIVSGTLDSGVLPEATSSAIGAVKKNRIIQKQSTSNYSSDASDILTLNNVPAGFYRVTLGAQTFKSSEAGAARLFFKVNGSEYLIPGTSIKWEVGASSTTSFTGEAQLDTGRSGTRLIELSSTSSISVDVNAVGTAPNVSLPYYILEKLENYEEITTEWD